MKIEIDFLGGDKSAKMKNEFMHVADMFPKSKQYAMHERLVFTGEPDLTKLCERFANSCKESGGYAVFVGIRKIDGKRVDSPNSWFMKGVNQISMEQNGTLSWGLFKDILTQLNYTVTVDEYQNVINAI